MDNLDKSGKNVMIDAHLHFWELDKFDYAWPNSNYPAMHKTFTLADAVDAMQTTCMQKAIIMQVLNNSIVETEHNLQLAESSDNIAGVVGWVDLKDPDVETTLQKLSKSPHFVGVRHLLDFEKHDWILEKEVQRGLAVVERLGLTYDLHMRPHHFKYVIETIKCFPKLKFVIDHFAKPVIKQQGDDSWAENMTTLSKYPNVFCKISGITSVNNAIEVKHVLTNFGVDRCMFGSDWPVCKMAHLEYVDVFKIVDNILKDLSAEDRAKVFGINAAKFYNVTSHSSNT